MASDLLCLPQRPLASMQLMDELEAECVAAACVLPN